MLHLIVNLVQTESAITKKDCTLTLRRRPRIKTSGAPTKGVGSSKWPSRRITSGAILGQAPTERRRGKRDIGASTDYRKQKQPRKGAVFVSAGPTRLPDGLSAIGTTSCVTNQLFCEGMAFHFLNVAFEFKRLSFCGELLCPDQSPRSFAFGGSCPAFVVPLTSENRIMR